MYLVKRLVGKMFYLILYAAAAFACLVLFSAFILAVVYYSMVLALMKPVRMAKARIHKNCEKGSKHVDKG